MVWYKMMATASLARPSPRMILKSFGWSSYLMMVTAAMMSELQSIEQISITSVEFIVHGEYLSVFGLYLYIGTNLKSKTVKLL